MERGTVTAWQPWRMTDMAVEQANGTFTNEGKAEVFTELDAEEIGTATTVHLYKTGFAPSETSVEADFVGAEADFDGYAAAPVTTWTIGTDAAGNPVYTSEELTFQQTTTTTPNEIAGAWLSVQSSVGPPAVNKAVSWYPFAAPVSVTQALQIISVALTLTGANFAGYASVET